MISPFDDPEEIEDRHRDLATASRCEGRLPQRPYTIASDDVALHFGLPYRDSWKYPLLEKIDHRELALANQRMPGIDRANQHDVVGERHFLASGIFSTSFDVSPARNLSIAGSFSSFAFAFAFAAFVMPESSPVSDITRKQPARAFCSQVRLRVQSLRVDSGAATSPGCRSRPSNTIGGFARGSHR